MALTIKPLLTAFALSVSLSSLAQESVKIDSTLNGRPDVLFAKYTKASGGKAAVVLIHSAGGTQDGTTGPLAEKLVAEGISTLELQLFDNPREARQKGKRSDYLVQQPYDALKFLVEQKGADPKRIGVAGFSMGAMLSIWTASQSLTQSSGAGTQFAAHAPIYPPCWLVSFSIKGEQNIPKVPGKSAIPTDAMRVLTKAPMKIFAAGQDDYDDRDPKACADMIALWPDSERNSIELVVYPQASHGWNQVTSSHYVPFGCKGKGCDNRNVNNPEVTAQNTAEVVEFFKKTLQP
jgi:dienelactone hydrolase